MFAHDTRKRPKRDEIADRAVIKASLEAGHAG
jgi:hypothetical protein